MYIVFEMLPVKVKKGYVPYRAITVANGSISGKYLKQILKCLQADTW